MRKGWIVLFIGALWVNGAQAEGFTLTSPQVRDGGTLGAEQVFNGFGCTGENVSPELTWSSPPAGTQSFAVTVYDPDAPTGSGWWHWVIFNIPAGTDGLAKNAGDPKSGLAPAGSVQSRTDFGAPGYGGPCPPPGDRPHHYIFTVYALKTPKLDLDSQASGAMVGFFVKGNSLGEASLTGLYRR